MGLRVLLVQDDLPIADTVATRLIAEGYDVDTATDGPAGWAAVKSIGPELMILDLALPGFSGMELIRRIREISALPIIVLSAKSEDIDKVLALELGADDYVTKPFSMHELIARVRAIARRVSCQSDPARLLAHVVVGGVDIDTVRRSVKVNDREVNLPPKPFEILRYLVVNVERVVSVEELKKAIWDESAQPVKGTIDVHMRCLRRSIEDVPARPVRIVNVRGVGYRFRDVAEQ